MGNWGFASFSSPPARVLTADSPPANPTPWDDDFDDINLSGKWIVQNKGASDVVSVKSSWLGFYAPAKGDGSAIFGIEQSLPTGNWEFRAKYAWEGYGLNHVGPQIWVRDSVSGRIVSLGTLFHSSYGQYVPYLFHQSSFTAYVGAASASQSWVLSQKGYLGLLYEGTTFYCYHSLDGLNFLYIIGEAKATYLAAEPTHIGIGGYHQNQSGFVSYDWFRRVS